MKTKLYIYYTTTSSQKEAKKISTYLFKKKACVCVNVFPKVKSYYIEDNMLQRSEEVAMFIKSLSNKSKFLKTINEIHNYKIPLITLIYSECLNKKYLQWAEHQTFYSNG